MTDQTDKPGLESLDLSSCAEESVQYIGSIQPHGCLLAVDSSGLVIRHASANASALFNHPGESLIGSALPSLLPGGMMLEVADAIFAADSGNRILRTCPWPLGDAPRTYQTFIHRIDEGNLIVIEIDLQPTGAADRDHLFEAVNVQAFEAAGSTQHLMDLAARRLRELTGFDRVMVYRFEEDGSGCVAAESRRPDLDPRLGLHYPASDIPEQARRLFVKSRVRMIADIDYEPVPIVSAGDGSDLDLSQSILRSVSPHHVQYLKNMGVRASLSLALVRDGELWGLIACHHNRPKTIPPSVLALAELVSQTLSVVFARQLRTEEQHRQALCQDRLSRILQRIINHPDGMAIALGSYLESLRQVPEADGVALVFEKRISTAGETPRADQIRALIEWLESFSEGGPYATSRLQAEWPAAGAFRSVASGLLAVRLDSDEPVWALWFRKERIRTVTWAGNPDAPAIRTDDKGGIGPRRSFEAWKTSVRGTSVPWRGPEIEAVQGLQNLSISATRNRGGLLASASRILSTSTDPVLIIDAEGRILEWNSAVEARLDVSEIDGGKLDEFLDLDDSVATLLSRAAEGEAWVGEPTGLKGDPNTQYQVSLVPIHGPDDGAGHVACVLRDVSETRRLQEQLNQAQKMETVGHLTGGVAHNFNNMLTVMMGYADFAMEALEPGHPAVKDLERLKQTGRDAAKMVADLMAFSRGKSSSPRRVDVGSLVGTLHSMLKQLIRADIEFTVVPAPRRLHAAIDPHQFEQVLMNLVVNAQDAIDGSGHIEIRSDEITVREEQSSRIGELPAGDYVGISVVDDGCGIPPDALDRIFDPFFTTKSSSEGTGLGLSTCQSIVRRLGGEIGVESREGEGSVFTVYLPRVKTEVTPETTESDAVLQSCTPGGVLIAEDDDSLRGVMTRIFELRGFNVTATDNGGKALEILNSPEGRNIDLVIADNVMPGKRGTDLARALLQQHPNLRVLLTSGYAVSIDDRISHPHFDFLEKPFSSDLLVDRVCRLLDGGNATEDNNP